MTTAGAALVSMLAANGIDRVFCVPGESYLPVLDALHDSTIDVVTCHHEGSAGFMALADARLSARPGVAFVSRGPGATNAAIAVHTAQQDAVPFLLFVGQVPRRNLRRGAFQEIDYGKMFGDVAKWVVEASDPARLVEVAARAFQAATAGTPGPVVVALPEDVLYEPAGTVVAKPATRPGTAPAPAALDAAAARLGAARKPLIIAGGALAGTAGRAALLRCAEAWAVPVCVSLRRHDLFPNDHPLFAGDLGHGNSAAQIAALEESDLVLAAGTRLGDITTQGYRFPATPWPRQPLIHVYDDPAMIGAQFRAEIGAVCDPAAFLAALAGRAPANAAPPERRGWADRLHEIRAGIGRWVPRRAPDGVVFGNVVAALGRRLEPDAIVTVDAGHSAGLLYKHLVVRPPQRLLATIAGVMGFGVPGAVAAALRAPGRRVLCVVGDGSFLMTGNELALAVERRLPIVIVLASNGSYGSIRRQQEAEFPGRPVGTALGIPDFALLARAFGAAALVLRDDDAIERTLGEAWALADQGSGPVLVEVKTSLSAILPAGGGAT